MPKYACFVLLAFGLLRPPSAAAEPICVHVALTGTTVGRVDLVNACVPSPLVVPCRLLSAGTPELGVAVVTCLPEV